MEKGILSTTSGGYIEYVPYLLFHNVSDTSVLITAFIFGIPLIGIGLYLQRYTKMKWGRSGFGLPSLSAIKSFGNLPFPTVPSQKVKLSQEAKDMLLLRKPYGTNLSTIILALDMIMVFIIGAGYTFNYLVITSSDGGRFFEYLLMLGNVHLFLNTPWFNDSLPIVDPSVLMVVMLCVGAFLSSYLSGDFKIRIPREKKRLLIGFLGGVLVGIGVRMA
ncbi:YeeE/YedE family protein, partial [Sulfolobus sp. A20-N-G8]